MARVDAFLRHGMGTRDCSAACGTRHPRVKRPWSARMVTDGKCVWLSAQRPSKTAMFLESAAASADATATYGFRTCCQRERVAQNDHPPAANSTPSCVTSRHPHPAADCLVGEIDPNRSSLPKQAAQEKLLTAVGGTACAGPPLRCLPLGWLCGFPALLALHRQLGGPGARCHVAPHAPWRAAHAVRWVSRGGRVTENLLATCRQSTAGGCLATREQLLRRDPKGEHAPVLFGCVLAVQLLCDADASHEHTHVCAAS